MSSTTIAVSPTNAYGVLILDAYIGPGGKSGTTAFVWPVRGGQ